MKRVVERSVSRDTEQFYSLIIILPEVEKASILGRMAKRLLSFSELDRLEGLVEHHRQLQERLEVLEADSAEFDTSAQETLELSNKANGLKRELAAVLEQLHRRVEGSSSV